MQDYPESLFASLKKGCFPSADAEFEKNLRLAFLYGMDASFQLVIQATNLDDRNMRDFLQDYEEQITRHLQEVGKQRAAVRIGTMPKNLGTNN